MRDSNKKRDNAFPVAGPMLVSSVLGSILLSSLFSLFAIPPIIDNSTDDRDFISDLDQLQTVDYLPDYDVLAVCCAFFSGRHHPIGMLATAQVSLAERRPAKYIRINPPTGPPRSLS